MKNKKNILLISALIVIASYFKWLLPFEHVSTDLHKLSISENMDRLDIPQMWTTTGALGLGQYDGFANWNWPIKFVTGIMMSIGMTSNQVHQTFLFISFLGIGYYSIYSLAWYFKISEKSSLVISVFYLVNTYILLIIDGGQLLIALSYALLPLCFLLTLKAVEKVTLFHISLASLSIIILGFFDIRFIYILFFLLSLRFLYDVTILKNYNKILSWVKVGVGIGLLFLIVNIFWLYPFIKTENGGLPTELLATSQLDFLNFTSLSHSLFAQQPHWPNNEFGNIIQASAIYILFPLVAFISVFSRKNIKKIAFWVGIALISIFLVKGANPPFGEIYRYLFAYLPGFSLFRDSTKFFFLLNLSYAILIGFSLDYFTTKKLGVIKYLFLIYIIFILVIPANFKLKGTFEKRKDQSDFLQLEQQLRADKEFSRVLWIPTKDGLSYTATHKPGIEALRIINKRPFSTGSIGRYDTLNFMRDVDYMGDIFDVYGIGYISYPNQDFKKQEDQVYYNTFINQINNLSWIDNKINDQIPTFKTKSNQNKFYVTDNSYIVSGSDEMYKNFSPEEIKLSNTALIFIDEFNYNKYSHQSFDRLPVIFDDPNDAIVSLSEKDIIPAIDVIRIDNDNFWMGYSDLITWRDFLEQKYQITSQDFYPNGIVVAEGIKKTTVNLNKSGKLFVRVFKSPKSEKIEFKQNNNSTNIITKIDEEIITRTIKGYQNIDDQPFEYFNSNFYWVEAQNIDPSNPFELNTLGEINVINQFAIIDEQEYQTSIEYFEDKEKINVNNVDFSVNTNDSVSIKYKRISPTRYQIIVNELTTPSSLIFAETYDTNWKLIKNDSTIDPYPVYSGLNGYQIEENGQYELYYDPQKYVLIPLIISSVSFITLVLYIISYEFRKRKKASQN